MKTSLVFMSNINAYQKYMQKKTDPLDMPTTYDETIIEQEILNGSNLFKVENEQQTKLNRDSKDIEV